MRQPHLIFDTEALCGRLLMAESRFEAAEQCYRRALEAAVDLAEVAPVRLAYVQDELGYCLMVRRRTGEGLRLVHAGLEGLEARGLLSQAAPLLLDLCYGYLQSGRYGAARTFGGVYLDSVVPEEDGAGRTALYLLAEACRLDGSDEEARRWLDRLAGLHPGFRMLRACLDAFDFRRVIPLKC